MILIITLLTWKELEDTQFPLVEIDVCEAAWYASLWHTKELLHAHDSIIFFMLLEMDLHMVEN